jgi:hypothetical protein
MACARRVARDGPFRCGSRERPRIMVLWQRGRLILRTQFSLVFAFAALASASHAHPLLSPGIIELRHDIQLLADNGVISAPVTTWPMSWPDIARQVSSVDPGDQNRAIAASLIRVQNAVRRAAESGLSGMEVRGSGAERPATFRTFQDVPRGEGELQVSASWLMSRVATNVSVTAASDPADDQSLRFDGSYLGILMGNWILSGGWIDRWWGPGWEGSLILASNARPMPAITFERRFSDPFRWRLLQWAGPWRATLSMGKADEESDAAVPEFRFLTARVSFRPRPWLEVALSRTAQSCGEGRPCDLGTLGDLLIGRDNRDSSLTAAEEPGNQMAGYDVRIHSPWRSLPAALYVQLIGEDEAGGLPSKFLGLAGAEMWGSSSWGSHRWYAEYADTSCNFSRQSPQFDCAYRSSAYPQGYTFRGSVMGHALGGDGRMYSLGGVLLRPDGSSLSMRARRITVNRAGATPEPAHPVSPARDQLKNLELQYNRRFARGELGVGLKLDDFEGPLTGGPDLGGFVQWRQGF